MRSSTIPLTSETELYASSNTDISDPPRGNSEVHGGVVNLEIRTVVVADRQPPVAASQPLAGNDPAITRCSSISLFEVEYRRRVARTLGFGRHRQASLASVA